MKRLILLLLLVSLAFAQDTTEGGNVTQLNITGLENSTRWDGLYGEVVSGSTVNYSHVVLGNQGVRINMVAPALNCSVPVSAMHIVAVNDSWITTPLSAGNLAVLDAFINAPVDNGTSTFIETASLTFSYGSFVSIPSMHTYAGGNPSAFFQQYYLNDAIGNMVFVADVVSDRPDWNGTTSDYQIILPNNGSGINYTLWVDVNYSCPIGPVDDPDVDKEHHLFVNPPETYEVPADSTFTLDVLVENPGDYVEDDIDVTLDCPAEFTCGSGFIPSIGIDDSEETGIPITVDGPGEYVITVCAESTHTDDCKDFMVRVVPECITDPDCPEDQYCDENECKDKKPPPELCERDGECTTDLCEDGSTCVYCAEDSNCASDEFCSFGSCVPVECPCGSVSDHTCTEYQCCADEDCGACSVCTGNSCVDIELEILVESGDMLEGEDIRVHVVDNLGRDVSGAAVFTSDMSTTADSFGYATVTIPFDGIIYASTSCTQSGIMLDISKIGEFVLPEEISVGEEVEIQVVDREGEPIVGAVITVGGDEYITDENGKFKVVFDEPGPKELRGNKPGYMIADELAAVGPGSPVSCQFPIYIGWFLFHGFNIWQLWVFAIVLALANVWLLHRRIRKQRKLRWKLLYALGPLVLALPNVWLLNICFIANIILLQFITELLLVLWKALGPPPSDKEKEGRPQR